MLKYGTKSYYSDVKVKIGILGPCSGRGPWQFGVRRPSDARLPVQETRIEDIAELVIDLAPLRPDRLPCVGKVEEYRPDVNGPAGAKQHCVSESSLHGPAVVSCNKDPHDWPFG